MQILLLKYVNYYNDNKMPKTYDNIKVHFFNCRADTGFYFEY